VALEIGHPYPAQITVLVGTHIKTCITSIVTPSIAEIRFFKVLMLTLIPSVKFVADTGGGDGETDTAM